MKTPDSAHKPTPASGPDNPTPNLSTRHSIGHFYPVWLPITMTWLFEQIRQISAYHNNLVLCEKTENRQLFDLAGIRSFDEQPAFIRLYQRLKRKTNLTADLDFFQKKLTGHGSQLLHSHFGHIGVRGAKIAGSLKIPHFVSFYGMDVHQIPRSDKSWIPRYLQMFGATDKILCEGRFMADSIIALGAPADKVTVHALGINLNRVGFCPAEWSPGQSDRPLKVLIAASFRLKKGIPDALMALSALSKEHPVEIHIIGDSGSDETSKLEKKRILDTLRTQNLMDITRHYGYADHAKMLEIARDCHIYLQPSKHAPDGDCEGGAPVSLIEMAASGKIVVSTRHCDIPGVIEHGKTGFLAEEGDIRDLTRKLQEAVAAASEWQKMQLAARKHIESAFDAAKQSKKLAGLYSEAIHG